MDPNKKSGSEEKKMNNSQEKGKKLECPFTWDFSYILEFERKDRKTMILKEKQIEEKNGEICEYKSDWSLLHLMHRVMRLFVAVSIHEESLEIEKLLFGIENCNKFLSLLKESNDLEVSFNVVNHIVQATLYFTYKKCNQKNEMSEAFSKINNIEIWTKKDKSTLIGCKGICYSRYRQINTIKAEMHYREAIKENPKFYLWYFELASILREKRGSLSPFLVPSDEEIDCFIKARDLSQEILCEIYVAHMYRDLKDFVKAKEIYDKIFNNLPDSPFLCLKVALGFIRLKEFPKADECLNKIKPKKSLYSTYNNYRGLYYFEQRMYEEAVPFFEEAIKYKCLSSDKNYLRCMIKVDRNFPVIEFLLSLLKKYEAFAEYKLQTILLDLALCYWKKENDTNKAIDYFLRVMECSEDRKCLLSYFDYLELGVRNNIICVLTKEFLPVIGRQKLDQRSAIMEKFNKLKRFCFNYYFSSIRLL